MGRPKHGPADPTSPTPPTQKNPTRPDQCDRRARAIVFDTQQSMGRVRTMILTQNPTRNQKHDPARKNQTRCIRREGTGQPDLTKHYAHVGRGSCQMTHDLT